ncbi:hypothetical protein GJAV_G00212830 [Gymnothorax javanicus]|nr:hypothetical protein GJAV_G00212830 [Gymnothorax javanicus]
MSDRRRSAAALSSRAHAFSVEALIGTNKKRKLRGWEEKELELSMESLDTNGPLGDGEDPAHCLDIDPDSEASPGSDSEGLAERTSCSFGSPSDLASTPCDPSTSSSSMEEIQVELQCADLWKRFHDIGTEMIITKAGRRMFPAMRVKILGLDPHQQYYIAMDIVPVDNKRYRYVYHSSKWMVAGNADSPVPPRVYIHPDSLASGDTWMRQVVSFDKLKLTNNELDDQGHVILHSMHKYQPRVHVIRKDFSSDLSPTKPVPSGEGVRTFSFPETVFTTVTAYQNQQGEVQAPLPPHPAQAPRPRQDPPTCCPPPAPPPTFHLAHNTFNVGCRESQLCNLNLSEYPACARSNMAALQGYGGLAESSYGRLQTGGAVASAQPSDSFLPQRTSSLIAAGMQAGSHASLPAGGGGKMEAYSSQLGSFPTSQLQYVMQAGGSSAPGSASGPTPGSSSSAAHMFSGSHHMQQGSYNAFSLHNPYNLYGYNFPGSPRLATSPEKLTAAQSSLLCSPSTGGAFAERQYLPNGMDGVHMISSPAGGQQGASACDGRQYGASSQMSVHMV